MIDFSLSSEQKFLIQMTRQFANAELAPGIAYRDRHSKFPKKQVNKMGELGLMGMMVPKEWPGPGQKQVQTTRRMAQERNSASGLGLRSTVSSSCV